LEVWLGMKFKTSKTEGPNLHNQVIQGHIKKGAEN
jgi:hypothetical protein